MTYRIGSKTVDRFQCSNMMKIIPVRSAACDTCSRSLGQIGRK